MMGVVIRMCVCLCVCRVSEVTQNDIHARLWYNNQPRPSQPTRFHSFYRSERPELEPVYGHLTSRDPAQFWTSGQWMTEKAGGSDVASGTQTIAVPEDAEASGAGSWFRLTGYKWFTSAADGEMAMALARERDANGKPIAGNKGLSLFYVPVQREDGIGTPKVRRRRRREK